MMDLSTVLQKLLSQQLTHQGFDLIDLLPLPKRGNKFIRLKTLEEVLDDFDSKQSEETTSYLVQIRPKKISFPELKTQTEPPLMAKPSLDSVFLPNGKLNVAFLMKNAELLFQNGECSLARNIYQTLYRSGTNTAQALYWIGRTYEAEGKFQDCLSYYDDSLAYHPAHETFRRMSAVLIQLKKYQETAELLERALVLKELKKTEKLEFQKMIGECWLNLKSPEKAENYFKKTLELEPLHDEVLTHLGNLYFQKGNQADAKRCFQEALSTNPQNANAHLGVGTCLYTKGEKILAQSHLIRSLEIQHNNSTAIFYLVRCAYETKNYSAAEKLVNEYIKTAPVNLSLLYSLAGLQFHLGKLEEAQLTAKKIIQLKSDHSGALELIKTIERYHTCHV